MSCNEGDLTRTVWGSIGTTLVIEPLLSVQADERSTAEPMVPLIQYSTTERVKNKGDTLNTQGPIRFRIFKKFFNRTIFKS